MLFKNVINQRRLKITSVTESLLLFAIENVDGQFFMGLVFLHTL